MKAPPSPRDIGSTWSAAPYRTILDLFQSACEKSPDRPALIFEDGLVVSRRELLDRVKTFAGYLRDRINPGDRIASIVGNRTEFMIAWLAVAANRATLVSINTAAREHDAGHVLRDSQAKMAIVGAEQRDLMEKLQSQCPALEEVVYVGEPEPNGLIDYQSEGEALDLSPEAIERGDIVNIYYTSGTTGPPKGCMVDHEYWLRFVDLFMRLYGMEPDDRLLCCLQFFYNDPPWHLLLSLHADTSLVVMRRFSVSRFWEVVRKNNVTIVFGIGSIASLLLKPAPTSQDKEHDVRFAMQVGISAALHRGLAERWGVPWVEGYGLTETGLIVSMPLEFADEMTGSGSIGFPSPEVSIRVVDEQDRDVQIGQPGEFIVQAPGLMRGYLNRAEATAETMRGGWLHTGDLGRADDRGFLYFLGRKKDIIRRGGENIAAAEVEQVIRSHPKVLEVAAIPVSDELRGEEVKIYVLPNEGESPETIPPEELVSFCADQLAKYKVPRYIEYRTSDFPRTPSMRVMKQELRKEREDLIAGVWDRERELGW